MRGKGPGRHTAVSACVPRRRDNLDQDFAHYDARQQPIDAAMFLRLLERATSRQRLRRSTVLLAVRSAPLCGTLTRSSCQHSLTQEPAECAPESARRSRTGACTP